MVFYFFINLYFHKNLMNINQKIRDIGKITPGGKFIEHSVRKLVYEFFYKNHLKKNMVSLDRLLVIGTIARSGTHYAMLLLSNYINLVSGSKNPIGPKEMNQMLPNNWHLHYMSYNKLPLGPLVEKMPHSPNNLIKNINLDDITRSHSIFQEIFWQNSQILHLYRNPLDYSVSLFNYKHKKRADLPNRCKNPSEVLELKFTNYCNMYNSYKNASKSGRFRILRISYENLIQEPEFYLKSILTWLGNEPVDRLIEKSVKLSSIKKVKTAEKEGGEVNPDAKDLKGSFISSGKIGQWKNFYTSGDFEYWKKRFREQNIEIENFILD